MKHAVEKKIIKLLRKASSPPPRKELLKKLESQFEDYSDNPIEDTSYSTTFLNRVLTILTKRWITGISTTIILTVFLFFWMGRTNIDQLMAQSIQVMKGKSFRTTGGVRGTIPNPDKQKLGDVRHPSAPMIEQRTWFETHADGHRSRTEFGDLITIWDAPFMMRTDKKGNFKRLQVLPMSHRKVTPSSFDPAAEVERLVQLEQEGKFQLKIIPMTKKKDVIVISAHNLQYGYIEKWWFDAINQNLIRIQHLSDAYSENGEFWIEIEQEFHDYGKQFDPSLFDLNFTDEEYADLGLDVADLSKLESEYTSFTIESHPSVSFKAMIKDESGLTQINGTLPKVIIHSHLGDKLTVWVHAEGSESIRISCGLAGIGVSGSNHLIASVFKKGQVISMGSSSKTIEAHFGPDSVVY